jgi:flagellar biosynthesis protein FlhG
LQLISGADDILGLANPKDTQKIRLFNHVKRLDADIILLDLGAGTSFTSMDFFLFAQNKIVVLTPQITSIQNAYGFIKSSLYRLLIKTFKKDIRCFELIKQLISPDEKVEVDSIVKLKEAFKDLGEEQYAKLTDCLKELKIRLVVNMVKKSKESDVGNVVQNVANHYLGLYPEYSGFIQYDQMLDMSINKMEAFLSKSTYTTAGECFYNIANKITLA